MVPPTPVAAPAPATSRPGRGPPCGTAEWQLKQATRWLLWEKCWVKREPTKSARWQLAQKVPAGMPVEPWITALLQVVLGPLRMNLAADPCGPFGSVAASESWQSVHCMRVVLEKGGRMFPVAPRLPLAVARTGWKLPAVSPLLQLFTVPAVA